MLKKVFQEITNKRKFFESSSTGEQFENQFRNESKKHFSEINGDLIEGLSHIEEKPNKEIKTTFNQLKKQVLEKNHSLLMAKACLKLICNHNIFLGV